MTRMTGKRIVLLLADTPTSVRFERLPKDAEIVVVSLPLVGRLRYWASDTDRARRAAAERLAACVRILEPLVVGAAGQVGDPDPLLAIDDVLRVHDADEIVVAVDARHRVSRNLMSRARRRFGLPVSALTARPGVRLPVASV